MTLHSRFRARPGTVLAATLLAFVAAAGTSADERRPASWERWNDRMLTAPHGEAPLLILVSSRICTPCLELESSLAATGFRRIVVDDSDYPRVAAAYRAFAVSSGMSSSLPLAIVATPALEPLAALDVTDRPALGARLESVRERWTAGDESLMAEAAIAVRRFRLNSAPLAHRETLAERAAPIHDDLLHGSEERRSAAAAWLKTIAASAVFDQLGGGFFRGAHDPEMRVPSFERSLDDQAVMLEVYLDAFMQTREPWFADVARMTAAAIIRDFTASGGAFHNGFGSKSLVPRDGRPQIVEGGACVWDAAEIRHLLGESDAAAFLQLYGMRDEGNIPARFDRSGDLAGKNIPYVAGAPANEESAKRLAAARAKLLDVRLKRPPARLDDRILAGPNARTIAALARTALVLDDEAAGQAARRAMRALLESHVAGPALYRTRGPNAIAAGSDDYALVIRALLDSYAITFEPLFLERAIALQKRYDASFWIAEENRYDVERGVPAAIAGLASDPALTRVAASNLARVADFVNDGAMHARAGSLSGTPVDRRRQIIIRGGPGAELTEILLNAIDSHRGEAPVVLLRSERERTRLQSLLPYLAAFRDCPLPQENGAACPPYAAVCFDGKCGPAIVEPERLRAAAAMRITATVNDGTHDEDSSQ